MASTTSAGVGSGLPADDQCRAELGAVLSSAAFRRSPKLSRLLKYLSDKQLAGMAGEITEYSIALDVLARDSQFDPQQDAIVRVDTHLLRKRLKEYYAGAGRDHQIQIVIPNGQYAPEFMLRSVAQPPVTGGWHAPKSRLSLAKPILHKWKWLAVGLAVAVLACGWAATHRPLAVLGLTGAVGGVKTPGVARPIVQAQIEEIRIAAGDRKESYIDTAGRTWLPDRYFTGGTTFRRPVAPIQRTRDPDLFQNGREGQFSYAIPLRPDNYELHLYFAETGVVSEALRSVNIAVNGRPVSTLDVASDAGGVNAATMKIFKDISPAKDGYLHLTFQGPGPCFVNAIEIVPGIPGKMRPIRLTERDSVFYDHLGQVWTPDQWAAGGRKSTRAVPIDGTLDVGLYHWQRFGHFSYSVPVVEDGRYTVILYFAETWFTPPNSNGGIGSRVFDVYCNGTTLLKNYDILREAGGVANRAVMRVFRHIPASPLGKIDLAFVPVANYALINAIEVVEE
ncbi:MAG: malectin domain-containing carbohydrate-binding protein [Bryobacteraceae bacterium]|jgi:hypothetical protein